MSAPMRSSDFRSIVEPILNQVFDGVYQQRQDEWKQIFRETPGTPRGYHEEPVLFGFQAAPELPDGQPVTYQQGGVLFIQRYVYRVFGLAFAMTQVLIEDGDELMLTSDKYPGTILVRIEGANLSERTLVLPYGSRLKDALGRMRPAPQANMAAVHRKA